MSAPTTPPGPDKLGLALAGGGFRASLFHAGVLRRLAELDVLRHVQVLSTVSGGSITGALYALRLKKWLEADQYGPRLSRDEYVALAKEVEEILCDGIGRNLRTRLFLNPLTTLRVLLTHDSMGRAMARLYERHLFHEAVLRPAGGGRRKVSWLRRGRERAVVRQALELGNLRVRPHGAEVRHGIDAYNEAEVARPGGSVLTQWIVNATSLNSGGRFFFSAVELGDWYLGAFRRDEVDRLRRRRELLLERDVRELAARVEAEAAAAMNDPERLARLRALSLALWWRRHLRPEETTRVDGVAARLDGWEALCGHAALRPRFPGDLKDCALGLLRQAKIAAWYLRFGHEATPPVTGGRSRDALWRRVLAVLGEIDRELANGLRAARVRHDDPVAGLLCEFIVELYLLRTADRVSPRFDGDWNRLSVSDTVGASACFPPVFPPLVLLGLYDDAHVTRLGLTDGGVYDNAGITALLDEGCTSIIASDTGGVFDERPDAPPDHVGLTLRLSAILTRVIGGVQRYGLRERKRISRELDDLADILPATPDCDPARAALAQTRTARELNDLAYFQIASPAPSIPVPADPAAKAEHAPPIGTGLDPRRVAGLRTDLDGFGDIEVAALINQGYDTADRFARGFLRRYAREGWNSAEPRLPRARVGGDRVDRLLDAGRSRFLRALRVGAPVSVGAAALAAIGLLVLGAIGTTPIALVAAAGVAWGAVLSAVVAAVEVLPAPLAEGLRWVPRVIPDIVLPWLGRAPATPVTTLALGAGLLALLVALRKPRRVPERRRRFVPLRTAAKWLASVKWNVLWLAWALPLLIAAATTLITAAAWALFFLPWRRAARIRKPGDEVPTPEQVEAALQVR